MEFKNTLNKKEDSKLINSYVRLINIKSNYFLEKFFGIIPKRSLENIKCNKNIQKRLNIDINTYKEYSENYSSIEIEIIPKKDIIFDPKVTEGFINIQKEKNRKYYHIYFNDNKVEEIKRTNLMSDDKVSKINIIIDHKIKSFSNLFAYCDCIESLSFKKFIRKNINNMNRMFCACYSLKELNLSNFNTENVTDMECMFWKCESLEELNLSKFNTNNVTNMHSMFCHCKSLKELNLSNFNTNKVTNMSWMFHECSSLKKINISSFNTNNVTEMDNMFYHCESLKELDLSNFNTNNAIGMKYMFDNCSEELKTEIRNKYKNFKEEAFYYYDSD